MNFLLFSVLFIFLSIIYHTIPLYSINKASILCKRFVSKQKVFFYKCIKDLFLPIMKACLPIYIQYPKQLSSNHLWEIQIDEFYLACSVHGNQLFFLLCVNRIPKLIQLIVL